MQESLQPQKAACQKAGLEPVTVESNQRKPRHNQLDENMLIQKDLGDLVDMERNEEEQQKAEESIQLNLLD